MKTVLSDYVFDNSINDKGDTGYDYDRNCDTAYDNKDDIRPNNNR